MTLMTLIVSDEFESPTVASSPCDPSMILGMIWIRSSELSRLAAVTAAVAASTTEVIWELVSEFERFLLLWFKIVVENPRAVSSLAVYHILLPTRSITVAELTVQVPDSLPCMNVLVLLNVLETEGPPVSS